MSDELNQKIAQISELLDQVKSPDKLAGLISLISNKSEEKSDEFSDSPPHLTHEVSKPKSNNSDDTLEMIMRVKKLLEGSKIQNDPRSDLLNSLKPFLSEKRQKSLTQCLSMLKMTALTKHLDEFDFLSKGGNGK